MTYSVSATGDKSGVFLKSLTGIRLFAALAIVLHHVPGHFGISHELTEGWSLGQGVSVFFVLSGFILTYRYPALTDRAAIVRFWVARVARIWPAHAFILFVLLLVNYDSMPDIESTSLKNILANVFLVQSWFPYAGYFFGYNSVSWSISTEMGFYLLFPFLIFCFQKTWLLKVFISFSVGFVFVLLAYYMSIPSFQYPDNKIVMEGLIYVNPLARLFEFVAGMCSAFLWIKFHNRIVMNRVLWTVLEVFSVLFLIFNVSFLSKIFSVFSFDFGFPGLYWKVMSLFPALAAAVFIFVMAKSEGFLSSVLSTRFFVYMGEVSFSIYLLHLVIIKMFDDLPALGYLNDFFALILALISVFVCSMLMFHFVEKPGKTMIISVSRLFGNRK
ncbi:acyltransferase family protein [Rhodospirillum rubrum]|uniref:Acyltransferase 3 n=1 Tax=Rhodospirillum rubrum (strain ATCC 11170 / ATH 1.1.1 / DSM 467 / LMG 4362 / NCIMB 8255 / S1) TaxID=269796 RepID=Q2RQN7_RHORT|nr:acyltransferase [Rhodospirillum rubrum]ABC23558.1 Acyltransferase 3 [Rhodospirillum rubrum ATCC 11170]AEO49296.1 acyltransferase 3 [Rhodospirillum rubrum F11]MBK5955232.1 acyltransferase [Rhodospirillum rubrum]QXG79524.1 acyltransferase [Rhodospirillum rubrum]HAP99929.1 acyltransferase [Rhodospirillum rubrum]